LKLNKRCSYTAGEASAKVKQPLMTNCSGMCKASQAVKHNRIQCFKFYISENRIVLKMLPHHHKLNPTKVIYMQNRNDVAAREDKK
jgi:hypothetical protein